MSLWGRIRRALAQVFSEEPPPPSAPPSRPRTRARGWDDDGARGGDLPPGWKFEALYHHGTGITNVSNPSDSDIMGADSILVSYTDQLGTDYRWIHGAESRKGIGRLITKVTIPESPVR